MAKKKKAKKKSIKKASIKKESQSVKKKPASRKGKGFRPSANVAGGKSYSKVAREVLEKTGDRAKATKKLKELGCSSAAAVVSKMAIKLGVSTAKEGKKGKPTAKKAVAKKKVVVEKSQPKVKGKAPKKIKKGKAPKKVKKEKEVELEEVELEEELSDSELLEEEDYEI